MPFFARNIITQSNWPIPVPGLDPVPGLRITFRLPKPGVIIGVLSAEIFRSGAGDARLVGNVRFNGLAFFDGRREHEIEPNGRVTITVYTMGEFEAGTHTVEAFMGAEGGSNFISSQFASLAVQAYNRFDSGPQDASFEVVPPP